MNRALPTRDRGDRSGTPHRQSGSAGPVLGAFGLIGRTRFAQPDKEKPPRRNLGGLYKRIGWRSGDRVAAFPVLALGGHHRQAHLFADGAGEEPADGMWLPACRFHQLFAGHAAGPLEQVEDLVGLAALAGGLRLLIPLPSATNEKFCNSQVQLGSQRQYSGVYVPTSAERAGNFSAFAGVLLDPMSNQPFPNNVIPVALWASVFAWRIGSGASATAANIQIVSGNNQIASVNQPFASPLVVAVTDTQGDPIGGINVNFTVNSGSASSGMPGATTNTNGQASTNVTAGNTAGAVVVAAAAASLAVQFSLTVDQSTPSVTSLSPPSATAGGSTFTLTVSGTNFSPSSTVQWNGTSLPTTFVSATQLTASVSATLITSAGTATIAVASNGAISAPVSFTITQYSYFSNLATTCPASTATEGVPYSSQLVASGGIPPYSWSVYRPGDQPQSGLSLNGNTGLVTGTPITTGTLLFYFTVTDSTGASVQQTCQIVVSPPTAASIKIISGIRP